MEQVSTITEFLETTGAQLRLFDMGRRIVEIPREQFIQFEKTAIPYPYPLQQKAWFAMLFKNRNPSDEPFIWFLQLPLDEQGKLLQASRDDLMHRLIERIGEKLQAEQEGQQLEGALQDNPYSFKPTEERMAMFHARVSRLLRTSPSRYYDHARDYFTGKPGWDQWSFVGYQGIADAAARLEEDHNTSAIAKAIDNLPAPPLVALCHCLENGPLPLSITRALLSRAQVELEKDEPAPGLLAAAIRATAQSRSERLQQELIAAILRAPCGNHIEILTAISGRAWEQLLNPSLSHLFLERLAENDAGQEAFNLCMADLLYLPGMREPILSAVRNPERSTRLSSAIGTLFQSVSGG